MGDNVAKANEYYENECRKPLYCAECKKLTNEPYHLRWCEECYGDLYDDVLIDFDEEKQLWVYVDANKEAENKAVLV
jgi:hypothetical protein